MFKATLIRVLAETTSITLMISAFIKALVEEEQKCIFIWVGESNYLIIDRWQLGSYISIECELSNMMEI